MEQHDKSHNRVISQNEFNEIYQKHIEWTKNTFGNLAPGDLSNTDLTNISFEKVENLDGFNFQNAILDNAKFHNVSMSSTNFSHASLNGVLFDNVSGDSCDFSNAVLDHSTFINSSFACSKFDNSDLLELYIYGTILKYSSFIKARMSKCWLISVNIKGALFNGSSLNEVYSYSITCNSRVKKIFNVVNEDTQKDISKLQTRISEITKLLDTYRERTIGLLGNETSLSDDLLYKIKQLKKEYNIIYDYIAIEKGEKKFSTYQEKVIALLWSARFWKIVLAVIAILGFIISAILFYDHVVEKMEKRKQGFTFYLQKYPIPDRKLVNLTLLLPESNIEIENLTHYLPIVITNNKNESLENLHLEIQFFHVGESDKLVRVASSKIDSSKYYYKHHEEVLQIFPGRINPYLTYSIDVPYKIYVQKNLGTLNDFGYVDRFFVQVFITNDFIEKPFVIRFAVNVFKANSIEDFLEKVDILGLGFLMPQIYKDNKDNIELFPQDFFIVDKLFAPKVTLWNGEADVSMHNSSFIKYTYQPKSLFKERSIYFYDDNNNHLFERDLIHLDANKIDAEKDITRRFKKSPSKIPDSFFPSSWAK